MSPLSASMYLRSTIARLRLTGYLEGVSLLLLVGIAVPIKYMGDNPLLVKILGPIHGICFLLYCYFLLQCVLESKWKFSEMAKVFVVAFIPLGFLFIRKLLRRKETE